MGPFEMVVLIVAIVAVAGIIKARYGIRTDAHGNEYHVGNGEALKLREEVKQLKERIHVLERIATDRENSLAREIESLRDR